MATDPMPPATTTADAPLGVFAQPGQSPPLNGLFRQLRELWVERERGRTYRDLAGLLEVPPQHVSQWATGSDGRVPPWAVLMALCQWTGYRIVAEPDRWMIEPSPQSRTTS